MPMPKTLGDFIREARARIREMDADTARERLGEMLVVDVREAEEFVLGHLPGASSIPRGRLEAAADPAYKGCDARLSRAAACEILLYCSTGARSALAAATLMDMGFSRVYSLAGGTELWLAEGYELMKESP